MVPIEFGISPRYPCPEVLYYHIAVGALQKARSLSRPFDDSTFLQRAEYIATSIVFATLTAETFINHEYAALAPQHFVTARTVRRMSLKEKWLRLPQNVGYRRTFTTKLSPFVEFRKLIDIRNGRLMHFKTSFDREFKGEPSLQHHLCDLVLDDGFANSCVTCIVQMIDALHRFTCGATRDSSFLREPPFLSTMWTTATGAHEETAPVRALTSPQDLQRHGGTLQAHEIA